MPLSLLLCSLLLPNCEGSHSVRLYDPTYFPFVGLHIFKMAAIMAAKMAAIKTTKPYNFETAQPILLKFGRYIYYMILHMFHLLGYTNSRLPSSWLPIWPPLKLQNPITFEPLSRFCSNLVDISIIWSFICFICWVTSWIIDSRWPPSWLPIWPPLKLQNPITFEPPSRFRSNLVDLSIIWSFICAICWVTQIQDGRYHGCQYGRH